MHAPHLSELDDANVLAAHLPAIASLTRSKDLVTVRFAAETLSNLTLKEINKQMILRAGGVGIFLALLKVCANPFLDVHINLCMDVSYSPVVCKECIYLLVTLMIETNAPARIHSLK